MIDRHALRRDPVAPAIATAYSDAGVPLPAPGIVGPIVPLQQILSGQPLMWSELLDLSRATVAAFLTRELGERVEADGPPGERLSGYLFAIEEAGWILVERREPVVRRRFTIAHELGHWLLHVLPCLRAGALAFEETQSPIGQEQTTDAASRDGAVAGRVWITQADDAPAVDTTAWEEEADRFAAELLMPEAFCRALVSELGPRYGDRRDSLAKHLAGELLVSQQAMRRRLTDLHLGVP